MELKEWVKDLPDTVHVCLFIAGLLLVCILLDASRDHRRDAVAYCYYGSVSRAQLEHCIYDLPDEVAYAQDSNAGAFARGELNECLADAGPFCEIALSSGG